MLGDSTLGESEMIKITGLSPFLRKTQAQRAQIKQGAANFVRQQTKKVLKDLVLNTPQWSGNTAAMWRVETYAAKDDGRVSKLYTARWKSILPDPSWKGDEDALKVSLAFASSALASIRYNTRIQIVNNSPVADSIADESIPLRSGNFIPGDAMAMKLAATKYRMSSEVVTLKEALIEK